MTYAPQALLDLRHYLQPYTGLSDGELGIVGDEAHNGGYHHGWDQRASNSDYSWSESARDSSRKTNAARAMDVGMFDRLREMSVWLVDQCASGVPDTADIREVIYSPDGKTVKRWDRLGIRSSGDSSHLTHTHISYFADAEDHDKTSPFRRFFEGDDDMANDFARDNAWRLQEYFDNKDEIVVPATDAAGSPPKFEPQENLPKQQWDRIEKAVGAITTPPAATVDIPALVAALKPEMEAAAERAVRKVLGAVDGATPPAV